MPGELIVLLARDSDATRLLYHALAKRFEVRVVLETAPTTWSLLQSRTRRLGLIEVIGQTLFMALVAKPMSFASRHRRARIVREHGHSTAPIPVEHCTRIATVNSPECWNAVRGLSPRLVAINGTRILSKRAIDEIGALILNTHVGITPMYRGVHGAYWALVQGDRAHCGVTVHLVDAGIDTGAILRQALINPTHEDNFTTYPVLQMAVGAQLLVEAAESVIAGTARPMSTEGIQHESRRRNHPTIWAYLMNRLRTGAR